MSDSAARSVICVDSPLLDRHNVADTPHNAGPTGDANRARADDGIARFRPR